MPELDIVDALEKQNAREEQQQLKSAVQEVTKPKSSDGRNVLIMVALLLGVFVLFTGFN